MASSIAVISSRGEIVIPKAVRLKFNLKEGSKLLVLCDGENIILKPIKEPSEEEFVEKKDLL